MTRWALETESRSRVRKRLDPIAYESPRGYLVRVSGCFSYASPCWLTELAGFKRADDLELPEKVNQLAYVLRLDPDEWRSMQYLKVKDRQRFWRRRFFGQLIAANRLNYGAPRICPACLRESAIWWGIWDLAIVSVCPRHRCGLVSTCQGCCEPLTWSRPRVHVCRCGFDFRESELVIVDTDLIAINAIVYQSAGFPVALRSFELGSAHFPTELQCLPLDDLIGLILAFSALQGDPRHPQRAAVTDLSTAQYLARGATHFLRDWPSAFHRRLHDLLPDSTDNRYQITFRNIYGDFYQFLLDAAHHMAFKFLIEAFSDFAARDWPGVIRGQHRLLPKSVRDGMTWIPAQRAARLADLTASQITDLVRDQKLTGILIRPPKSHGRAECWVDRERLAEWIVKRNSDLSDFISQAEAMTLLGLTAETIKSLANHGLFETRKGPDGGFPAGTYIRRQQVQQIVRSLSIVATHMLPSHLDRAVSLREGMRRYLGREGLSEFIRHILSGTVRPVGKDPAVPGILGFLFRVLDVKSCAPTKPKPTVPSGLLTYTQAAATLKTNVEVLRNLVASHHLQVDGASFGRVRLLRTSEVAEFESSYVALKSIADRLQERSRTLSQDLKRKGVTILSVPLPGKGNKLFVKRGPRLDLALRHLRQRG